MIIITYFFYYPFHLPFVLNKHLTCCQFLGCWDNLNLCFWWIWTFGSPTCIGFFCCKTWERKRCPSSRPSSSYSHSPIVIHFPLGSHKSFQKYSNPILCLFFFFFPLAWGAQISQQIVSTSSIMEPLLDLLAGVSVLWKLRLLDQ